MTRLKDVATINREVLPESTDPDLEFHYVDIGSVKADGRIATTHPVRFAEAPSRARRVVRAGDSIVSTVRTYLRAIAHVGAEAEGLVVSTGFATLSPRPGIDPRYLTWAIRGREFIEQVVARSVGVSYPAIAPSRLGELPIEVPDLEDQRRIADYLDRETGRIDRLVREEEALIRVIWERRRAEVFAGVTGANEPGSRTAGVPWTDSVPEGWVPTKLATVAALGSGHTPARNRPELWVDCEIPWVTTGEVWQVRSDVQEEIFETRERVSKLGVQESSAVVHPRGTVVLCRTAASAGYSALMGSDMATSQDFATWTCGPSLRPRFLLHCLRAMRADLLGRLAMGSTHRTIYMPEIKGLIVPLPPLDVQDRVITDIQGTVSMLDTARLELETQIALLREHRDALITHAVTKGIDGLPGVA